jgi:hypothetical protein
MLPRHGDIAPAPLSYQVEGTACRAHRVILARVSGHRGEQVEHAARVVRRHRMMRTQPCFGGCLAVVLLAGFSASAQEAKLFAFVDGKASGCFVHLAGKDWVEFAADGAALAYHEAARDTRNVDLLDEIRGVSVRLLPAKCEWKPANKARKSRQGTWTRAVDLRPEFVRFGLRPRLQGSRGTCSVFASVGALEFGIARKTRKPTILSVDFLNWASNEVAGDKDDGSFFANCLEGFRRFGLCPESSMPYHTTSDPSRVPSPEAIKKGAALRRELGDSLQVHWILPPWNDESGLSDRAFMEVKATLARGFPVAFGSAHSILLVGFRDDSSKHGGGEFLVKDSAQPAFGIVSYAHVKEKPFDVYWIDFHEPPSLKRTRWEYPTGLFSRMSTGNWVETTKNGDRYEFQERARSADFVELFEDRRQLTLRIYGDTHGQMFHRTPQMRRCARLYDGRWVE